jgi:hypothetical protein
MNSNASPRRFRTILLMLPAFAVAVGTAGYAAAQYAPPPPPPPGYVAPPAPPPPAYVAPAPVDVPPPPPDAYVATVAPEYFEGRPVYLYNNLWYFRDEHGAWQYYRHEPEYLRGRRGHWGERGRYHYHR